jgi:hypothetical protein
MDHLESNRIELPEDWWHTYVYVYFGWLSCGECEVEPDLEWIWEGVTADGENGVAQFTLIAVDRLKDLGWTIRDDGLCCPKCSGKKSPNSEP